MNQNSDQTTEQHLVKQAQNGDPEAFGRLVTRYQQRVYRIAYRITGNSQEAEDVAQESFIKSHQALNRFDTKRPFAPWLYRITTNTALNHIKRRQRESNLDPEAPLRSPHPDPETQTIMTERQNLLHQAIKQLPPNYRAVIELRHFQGLSYQEIGNVLDEPLSTVKSWLFRARRKLREVIHV